MSKFHVAHAVGKRLVAGCGPEPVEAVHIAGFASLVSVDEALAMGADVKRIVWLDGMLSGGREMVRYSDMSLGGSEQAEANGFSVKPMPKHMREHVERDRARMAADDAAFAAARKQRLGPKAATVDKPHSSAPSPSSPVAEQPLSEYAAAVLSSEEAQCRPSAARTLLRMHQNESTLSLSDAAALLAALPIEHHNIEAPTMSYSFSHADAATEKVIVRSVEIRALGLSQKGARGDVAAKAEARRLNTALADYRNGTPIGKALHSAGADVAAISDATKRALGAAA